MASFSPPPQKGYTGFPGWFYGPNGQAKIFAAAKDVPAGWAKHPADVVVKATAKTTPAAPAAPTTLTKEQVIAALQEAGVAVKATDSLAALYKQLEAVAAAS